jgi:hypothetical protein
MMCFISFSYYLKTSLDQTVTIANSIFPIYFTAIDKNLVLFVLFLVHHFYSS